MTNIKKLMIKKNVKGLIKALKDEDIRVREKAAIALAGIGDPRAIEPLFQALNDFRLSETFAVALGILGDPRAFDPSIRALKDKSQIVRERAAKALGNIGDPRAIEPLIQALVDTQYAAVRALAKIGNPAVEPLIQALKDLPEDRQSDHLRRSGVAKALGKIRDPRAVEPLRQALENESTSVRAAAAKAIGNIGNIDNLFPVPVMRALTPSFEFLAGGKENLRRILSKYKNRIGIDVLFSLCVALQDPDWIVRKAAAKALGKIGGPFAVEALRQALKDKDYSVRRAAELALYKIEPEKG